MSVIKEVKVMCDRCKKEVDGMEDENGNTAGFYNLTGTWKPFAKEGETKICDECMWKDPEYKKLYSPCELPKDAKTLCRKGR